MSRLLVDHTFLSSIKRLVQLLRAVGARKTLSVFVSVIDDHYLRVFDRKYNVKTSGHIRLNTLSFAPGRLPDATQYGPVNAWALRRLLKDLNLPRSLHFVDLGCGLGRACLLAADYGFEKVTGVDLAPELCEVARQNIRNCRLPGVSGERILILDMDALNFCDRSDDDVFFMYRPFSKAFLDQILEKLALGAARRNKQITIIYSERMAHTGSHRNAIAEQSAWELIHEGGSFGQAFYVYRSANKAAESGAIRAEKTALAQVRECSAGARPL